MGRVTGKGRRVAHFCGRQTCDEKRVLAGFILFACRARSELVWELLQLLRQKPSLPTKLRSAVAIEIFSLFAQQMEDVCQWLTALKDLTPNESLLDAVKNTSLNDNDRTSLATWMMNTSNRGILNSLAGRQRWAREDLADAGIAKDAITAELSEMVDPKLGLRRGFPVHVWEALKHGYVAVYGLKPRSRTVSVLTQGAGLRDLGGNEAIFEIPADVKKIYAVANRMEGGAKAFSWLMGVVYKSRYSKWPEGPPRHLAQV